MKRQKSKRQPSRKKKVASKATRQSSFSTMGVKLFDGADPTRIQRPRPSALGDSRQALTRRVHRDLVAFSRNLFWNYGPIRAAIRDKANLCITGGWNPQYLGEDDEWGRAWENYIWGWMHSCDVRGPQYNFWTLLRCASIALDVDGDFAHAFVADKLGFPMIQAIPGHRIDSPMGDTLVAEGTFKGREIMNGVIVDESARAIGYRYVHGKNNEFIDVPASSLYLCFDPDTFDQIRGIPSLVHAILDGMDLQDIQGFVKSQIKLDATRGFKIKNESGDSGQQHMEEGENVAGQRIMTETIDGIENLYFKAGSGEDMEAMKTDRPSPNVPAFMKDVLRGDLQGAEWAIELYDIRDVGGAPLRVIVDKSNFACERRRGVLSKFATPAVAVATSSAIEMELIRNQDGKVLSPPDDWFNFDFSTPRKLTADAAREAEIDRLGIEAGTHNYREVIGGRGYWWREHIEQKAKEIKFIHDMADKYGIDVEEIRKLLQNPPSKDPAKDDDEDAVDDTKGRNGNANGRRKSSTARL